MNCGAIFLELGRGCLRLVISDYNCYEGRQLGSGLICLLIVQHFWVTIKPFQKSEYKTQLLNVIESWCLLWRGFKYISVSLFKCVYKWKVNQIQTQRNAAVFTAYWHKNRDMFSNKPTWFILHFPLQNQHDQSPTKPVFIILLIHVHCTSQIHNNYSALTYSPW